MLCSTKKSVLRNEGKRKIGLEELREGGGK